MAYIGRPLNAGNLAVQSGTGDGADTTPIATLDYSVGSSNSIGVYLDGVRQLAGTDFTASGTTLTFTTAPANSVGIDVYFLGLELSIPTPADATVTAAKLASDAVTSVKIIDDAVTLAKMAPGTDGNIISYDASGNPVAIATGTDGQVLTSTGAGSPPAFETLAAGATTTNMVQATYNLATASGTQSITGAGFTPTSCVVFIMGGAAEIGASWGLIDVGNAQGQLYYGHGLSSDKMGQGTTNLGIIVNASGAYQVPTGTLTSDGIDLAWAKTGSPTGTAYIKLLFFK